MSIEQTNSAKPNPASTAHYAESFKKRSNSMLPRGLSNDRSKKKPRPKEFNLVCFLTDIATAMATDSEFRLMIDSEKTKPPKSEDYSSAISDEKRALAR